MHETFWTLIHDLPHWEFEVFLQALDALLFGILWNKWGRVHWQHHLDRDKHIEAPRTNWGDTELPY